MTAPPDGLVTTEQAAELLGITAGRIRKWKHRRKVTPAGMVPGRRHPAPLYRLDELRTVLAESGSTTRRQGPDDG